MRKSHLTTAQRRALVGAIVGVLGATAYGIRYYVKSSSAQASQAAQSSQQTSSGSGNQQQVTNTGVITGGVSQTQGNGNQTQSK